MNRYERTVFFERLFALRLQDAHAGAMDRDIEMSLDEVIEWASRALQETVGDEDAVEDRA